MKKILSCLFVILVISSGAICSAANLEYLDFEVQWKTESDLLDNGFQESDLAINGFDTLSNRMFGAKLSASNVKSGTYSLRWNNHPFYPTIGTKNISGDFSSYNTVSFWVYSLVNTGEVINMSLFSDNEATAWKDFYTCEFSIDFTGWKQFVLPFSQFQTVESPVGFNKIDGVHFNTKMYYNVPNPNTDIYLDKMELTYHSNYPTTITNQPMVKEVNQRMFPFVEGNFNHNFREINDESLRKAPIIYQPYFKSERATLGYYPKFNPAPVSFDINGKAYLKYGAFDIQTVDNDGIWHRNNLRSFIDDYLINILKYNSYSMLDDMFYDETYIRFDNEYNAYIIITALCYTQSGGSNIISALLYSTDGLETFKAYKLPKAFARFERLDGNNADCLSRPPVILLSQMWTSTTDLGGYILIPEKQSDGLYLSNPTMYSDSCISSAVHSGDSNFAVTFGDKVYIIYGVETPKSVLNIPANHPANSMTYTYAGQTVNISGGIPSFVISYDINTRILSEPVFVGYGGHLIDNHNWGAISLDSFGKLHVIINGHHNPFYYISTKNSGDITEWNTPELVGTANTYASMIIDKNNTIYVVTRDSARGYRFDLNLSRKKYGEPWQTSIPLLQRNIPYYAVWNNKLSIDPKTGNLYLSYFGQAAQYEFFKDQYDSYLYVHPEVERAFLEFNSGKVPVGTLKTDPKTKFLYKPNPAETSILTSDDGGNTWELAITKSFVRPYIPKERISRPFFKDTNGDIIQNLINTNELNINWNIYNSFREMNMLAVTKKSNSDIDNVVIIKKTKRQEQMIAKLPISTSIEKVELYLWDENNMPLFSKFVLNRNEGYFDKFIVNDSFEAGLGKWNISGVGADTNVSTVDSPIDVLNHNKVLKLQYSGSALGNKGVIVPFESKEITSGKYTVECDFLSPLTGAFYQTSIAQILISGKNNQIQYPLSANLIASFEPNNWHHLKAIFDIDNKSLNMNLDGIDLPIQILVQAKLLPRIDLSWATPTNNTIYYDNIKVQVYID